MSKSKKSATPARQKLEVVYRSVGSLKPYENNPRLNENAIPAVMASIKEFGFRVPVIVDGDDVIVAGHTRVLAVQRMIEQDQSLAEEFGDVPVLVASDLTPAQVRAFRLVDNKVAEISVWDMDLLAVEAAALEDTGLDLTSFGWQQEEIDCLHNVVSNDCLLGEPTGKGDGVNAPKAQQRSLSVTPDGMSVRIAVGSLAFFVLREDFEKWNDGLHKDANYNPQGVIDECAKRLGLYEQMQRRDALRGSVASETEQQVQQAEAHATA